MRLIQQSRSAWNLTLVCSVFLSVYCPAYGGGVLQAAYPDTQLVTSNNTQSMQARPNVLFIAIDDLNDWVGCLGGHPQSRTPNLDRLAESGVLFVNAHCPAPACNPCRSAVMTGMNPNQSGVYRNGQSMRDIIPDAKLIPRYFSENGYWSAGSGKIMHYFIDAKSWDDYFPEKNTENPFPRTLYPRQRPVSLPRAGPWQYVETDWGPLQADDKTYGGDFLVAEWVSRQLSRKHDQPFFVACGIYRPHEPWFVPQKYFDRFPLDKIQLPPGYKADDLDDLPASGKKRGPNRYFDHIRKHGQWKKAIQGYLASISFADEMLGKVLKALEKGPNSRNTIVVLWSDHGWHLGEKQHWQKFTGWRVCTRVPLIVRVPKGCPGLPSGTPREKRVNEPVNLVSLFATLTELTGLPPSKQTNAPSLVPLLKKSNEAWKHDSITFLGDAGSVAISSADHRYIRYKNGDEELYTTRNDPFEWNNLAANIDHHELLTRFRQKVPTSFATPTPTNRNFQNAPRLKWSPASSLDQTAKSLAEGKPFPCQFENTRKVPVKLHWKTPAGALKYYATIRAGEKRRQSTRKGAVWVVTDFNDVVIGYFIVGNQPAVANIKK